MNEVAYPAILRLKGGGKIALKDSINTSIQNGFRQLNNNTERR